MTNQQLYFAIGLPCLTIIVSLIVNLLSISGLNGRIDSIQSRIDSIQADIREIRGDLKSIVAKIGAMDVEIGKLMDRKA